MPEHTLQINKEIKINYIIELHNLLPFWSQLNKELLHQTQKLEKL